MRFFLDEHIAGAVADALRRRGFDVLTVKEARALGAPDIDHFEFARAQQRIIVTQDADFLRIRAAGESHAGIVYAPQGTPVGKLVRTLWRIVETLDAERMKNHAEFV